MISSLHWEEPAKLLVFETQGAPRSMLAGTLNAMLDAALTFPDLEGFAIETERRQLLVGDEIRRAGCDRTRHPAAD